MPYLNSISNYNEPVSEMLFTETEAKNLRFRLQLMLQLLDYIRQQQWTAQQAAINLNTNVTTIYYLLQRKISFLTTDQLLNMLEQCGFEVYDQFAALINSDKE
jgi:predicted XRE-type DNA-binding protein